jgi:hypothetical protein
MTLLPTDSQIENFIRRIEVLSPTAKNELLLKLLGMCLALPDSAARVERKLEECERLEVKITRKTGVNRSLFLPNSSGQSLTSDQSQNPNPIG